MKWVKSSNYSIKTTDDRFHIAKYIVNDKPIYGLWDGKTSLGNFESAEKAKERANVIHSGERSGKE